MANHTRRRFDRVASIARSRWRLSGSVCTRMTRGTSPAPWDSWRSWGGPRRAFRIEDSVRRSWSLKCQCWSKCASVACEPADNHNLYCYCYLWNNDDGYETTMLMIVDFRKCMLRCCLRTSMDQHSRASFRRCRLSEISFLNRMANDGNWRRTSIRWNYLVEFLTMTRSLRSLERRMRLLKPMWCWVWLDYCYSN